MYLEKEQLYSEKEQLIIDLYKAYLGAAQNKGNSRDKLNFDLVLEDEIVSLADSIINRTYQISPSICFIVEDPVKREIISPHFRDRVIHHYIHQYIYPYLERKLIYDCYSCRKGKGTHFGINRMEHHIRSCSQNYTKPAYALQLDIKGYFMHINRELLYQKAMELMDHIGAQIGVEMKGEHGLVFQYQYDKYCNIKYLLNKVILHNPISNCKVISTPEEREGLPKSKSLFHSPEGCGLPIGNLTSQLFSNLYLNEFDHYIKRELKIKRYGRYVDDFYIIADSKKDFPELIRKISKYLKENFYLDIHPNKIEITNVKRGVTFLGVHLKPHRRYIKNNTRKRMAQKIKDFEKINKEELALGEWDHYLMSASNSFLGLLKQMKTYKIRVKMFEGSLMFDIANISVGFEKFVFKGRGM